MIWVAIYILPIRAITIHLSLFTLLLFSLKVMPDSVTHRLQNARFLCPPLSPGVAQTHAHRVGDAIQPSNPLSPSLPLLSIFPSIRVFSNESALLIKWPKRWSFSISPSSEYSELISFSNDWLDLLDIQGTLKSLFQHHNSKASVL